jgi:acetylornithine deacetylase/succinyl-diaminopimelate desuccinylase-like protein
MDVDADRTHETVELLQELIRAGCVNDGTPDSGGEDRAVDVLTRFLEGGGVELETFEARPGRGSLVARIEGTDPDAPTICLCGHTDVVPVTPSGWREDPFGAELIDGEVWGRGAVDMLNLTASMAVAFRHVVTAGPRPRGTLVYFAVADEEAGGRWGAEWMAEEHWDAVGCDYLLTEMGGIPTTTAGGKALVLTVAEKGLGWRKLTVRGTPGHGSMPLGTDNALVKGAEVVRRLADYRPRAIIHDLWRRKVDTLGLDDATREALLDPERAWDALLAMDDPGQARHLHACSHTTFSPNVLHGGVKTNVIPDVVEIELDVRTLPGETDDDVEAHLLAALGEDLRREVEVEILQGDVATASPIETPMWDALERIMRRAHPDAELLPSLIVGGTDARFFRDRDAVAYGAGLFSPKVTFEEFSKRFHGNDERVDVESLGLSTQLWIELARDWV